MLPGSCTQAVNYRLVVDNLSSCIAAGSYVEAAYVGLRDTANGDAPFGHARQGGGVRAVPLAGSRRLGWPRPAHLVWEPH